MALRGLRALQQEICELSVFLTAFGGTSPVVTDPYDDFFGKLDEYAGKLEKQTSSCMEQWVDVLDKREFTKQKNISTKLEGLLTEAVFLNELAASCNFGTSSKVESLNARIDKLFAAHRASVECAFSAKNKFDTVDYGLLSRHLHDGRLVANFKLIREHAPFYESLKNQAHTLVSNHATYIEKLTENTSNFDLIDGELQRIEKAEQLDKFIGLGVASRLGPLRKLRSQKETDVDEALVAMIDDEQYKGLKGFLEPYANSDDQLKRQKFVGHRDVISKNLSMHLHAIDSFLEVAQGHDDAALQQLEDRLDKIDAAISECGNFLKGKIDLREQKQRIQSMFKVKMSKILSNFEEAELCCDLLRMATAERNASRLYKAARKWLDSSWSGSIKRVSDTYTAKLDTVGLEMEIFFDSGFVTAASFLRLLNSLKNASQCQRIPAKQLSKIYSKTQVELETKLKTSLETWERCVDKHHCYYDGVLVLHSLSAELERGLDRHLTLENLPYDPQKKAAEWESILKQDELSDFAPSGFKAKAIMEKWAQKLDGLQSESYVQSFTRGVLGFTSRLIDSKWKTNRTYEYYQHKIWEIAATQARFGHDSLTSGDYERLHDVITYLKGIADNFDKHVPEGKDQFRRLMGCSQKKLLHTLQDAMKSLEAKDFAGLESYSLHIRGLVLNIPCIFDDRKVASEFRLFNQLVKKSLDDFVSLTLSSLTLSEDVLDFASIRCSVLETRVLGGFVADHFTVFEEECKTSTHEIPRKWMDDITQLSRIHFKAGRDFSRIRECAILGVTPSATENEIKRAFKSKARKYHPDKVEPSVDDDTNARFRRVKEAYDELLNSRKSPSSTAKPFDDEIRAVATNLRSKMNECLEQRLYKKVKSLLFNLPGLAEVEDLVSPPLNSITIARDIEGLVKNYVNQIKINIDSLWAERNLASLHEKMKDLREMQSHVGAYPNIIPDSLISKIMQTIRDEIAELGEVARSYLSSKAMAKSKEVDFRRCFLAIGSVYVELPMLKDYTKVVISEVLESCLLDTWGFGFLFELGLSLHRGDGSDDADQARVAHIILAEFSHFKEVLTMVWNTQTLQKPAEDSVKHITAQSIKGQPTRVFIDSNRLLESFERFDGYYGGFLGEFIKPDADLSQLVQRIDKLCKNANVKADSGWVPAVRNLIPQVLAGVFAVFTVCKSGSSFNRISETSEKAKLGQQLLMKPHSIQILTILCMFGCDSSDDEQSLKSQLLQIRTGEGKSMILGAAATVLALFEFRIRCECYSEYLSNRDYGLFEEVFRLFGVRDKVKYSKITAYSEDAVTERGDIRSMTLAQVLHGQNTSTIVSTPLSQRKGNSPESKRQKPAQASAPSVSSNMPYSSSHSDLSQITVNAGIHRRTVSSGNSSANHQIVSDAMPHRKVFPSVADFVSTDAGPVQGEEILLVDEVDVFFGSEFYGQTYDQVVQLQRPEIQLILKMIWRNHDNGGKRLRLSEIKATDMYKQLANDFPDFVFLLNNEITFMLDQVRRIDDTPYFLDEDTCRIGYKVMDTITYDVTYGYLTAFAYLRESDAGRLKNDPNALDRALCMNISCGQFSYADIHPSRILGVSGTLEAIGEYERNVLLKYGIEKFIFMPSVYGPTNLSFDKAGRGIYIEDGESDFYQRICTEAVNETKQNRAVLVFFGDDKSLRKFENSSNFKTQLGRHKAKLVEDMEPDEKDFVIKKAATAKQVTICTAIFGRGTDFFCKDSKVEDNGGVHVIQTFLSVENSEEKQIMGRTARQGLKGTYQMILMESDLENDFGLKKDETASVPEANRYGFLSESRKKAYQARCEQIEENLQKATERNRCTKKYFDALLAKENSTAKDLFMELYRSVKKAPLPTEIIIDIACVIDVTGSMTPYLNAANQALETMLNGKSSIGKRLKIPFPGVDFKLRAASLAFRDIEDKGSQFSESNFGRGHFSNHTQDALQVLAAALTHSQGGFDLAEDVYGAIHRCASWNAQDDWTGMFKVMIVMTDAPTHGMVPQCSTNIPNADNYGRLHPDGLTAEMVVDSLIDKDIDLFMCSFNPHATAPTEDKLAELYMKHPNNADGREIVSIPMVPKQPLHAGETALANGQCQHIIFVLDESGSMSSYWSGVVVAYKEFLSLRLRSQSMADLISVVQFDSDARNTVQIHAIGQAPKDLGYSGGGTNYTPAATLAQRLLGQTPSSHVPVVVFMSDGLAYDSDANNAARIFQQMNHDTLAKTGKELELHVIAFGAGFDQRQLVTIKDSSRRGRMHTSIDTRQLSNVFVDIAKSSQQVAKILEAEVGRRVTEAMSNKLSLEYIG